MSRKEPKLSRNTQDNCILCQCPDSTLVQIGALHAPHVEIRRCLNCGLVFLYPQSTEAELNYYYTELFRQDYREPPVAKRYWGELAEALKRIHRLLPHLHANTHLLEVGSGSGAFLNTVHPYVQEVVGIEPDKASSIYITNQIKLPLFENIANIPENKTFDLVVLFHVLEHIANPARFLQSLKQVLQPDGLLIIEVPNVEDVLVAVYQIPAFLRFYYQKAHLFYFSKSTLEMTFKHAGFNVSIEGVQRYDLSNHMRWMLTGQPGGQDYYSNLLSPAINGAYAESLIRTGHSDTLWAVAKIADRSMTGD